MSNDKQIWLPKSELNVRVKDGEVTVWEDMQMVLKPVKKQVTGFQSQPEFFKTGQGR